MGAFARGKYAYGISDRSGFRYKLNSMKREWNGSLVGPTVVVVGVPLVVETTFTPIRGIGQVGTVTVSTT